MKQKKRKKKKQIKKMSPKGKLTKQTTEISPSKRRKKDDLNFEYESREIDWSIL